MGGRATPVLIRAARREDAQFLALVILTATRSHVAKGWFEVALNRSESECLGFLRGLTSATTRSPWHYSGFLIADTATGPVAALCAARAADIYKTASLAIREALKNYGFAAAHRAAFWNRAAPWLTCALRPDNACLAIENVAALPNFRQQGYTAALLDRAFAEGRAQGLNEAQVTCLIGNVSAERAYLRAGLRLVSEWHDLGFEAVTGAPGMRKFARSL